MTRIFISFAMEDKHLRDFLVGQKTSSKRSFNFTDYSVKQPWSSSWKTNCRERIKTCRGMIGIITPNTTKADGQLWELKCAIDERIPLMLIHGHKSPDRKIKTIPSVISGRLVNLWTEQNIENFLLKVS